MEAGRSSAVWWWEKELSFIFQRHEEYDVIMYSSNDDEDGNVCVESRNLFNLLIC